MTKIRACSASDAIAMCRPRASSNRSDVKSEMDVF